MSAPPPGLDETHAPELESWVEGADAPLADFPVQNLPFGRFRRAAGEPWRLGVAIGDFVLDLREAGFADHGDMDRLLQAPLAQRRALRLALSRALRRGAPATAALRSALHPLAEVELGLPCDVGDYTDFYVGIHHAAAVGRLFRPQSPLLPNYRWVPIGYHGRASTLVPSGTPVARPQGQVRPDPAQPPRLAPTRQLDFELELALVVGRGNARGEPVPIGQAEAHLFGITLLNDWSARDLQAWEYQPLGPFLSKSFASTVSPWIVTLEALAPFRTAPVRAPQDPRPLPYLDDEHDRRSGAFDIRLQVELQTAAMARAGRPGDVIATSGFAEAAYWTAAQLVAHHTVNGCLLRSGDLLGTGTLSGPGPLQAGSLLERTAGGREPLVLSSGEARSFLEPGDRVGLRAWCERPGRRRIGFGPCTGMVAG